MVSAVFPLITASIAGIFATIVFSRYLHSKRRHNLLWALGLYGITAAALCQLTAELNGSWPEPVYRFYYFLAGSQVAVLGAGTVYLMKQQRAANGLLYIVVALVGVQAVVCSVAPVDTAHLAAADVESGVKAASLPMRILTGALNIFGVGAMLLGVVMSYLATRRPHNLFILGGTIAFSVGGTIAGLFPNAEQSTMALYVGNMVGILLLFLGFWLGRPAHNTAAVTVATAAWVGGPRR